MSISYQCRMIQAVVDDIADGATFVIPAADVVEEVYIHWLTSARPRAISAIGGPLSLVQAPILVSLFDHEGEDLTGVTVTVPQTLNRPATIDVEGANGTYRRRAWLTKASWQYDEAQPLDSIQFHYSPATLLANASPIPFLGDGVYEGMCVILRASDYRGQNRIEIAGLGSVVVVGLWTQGPMGDGGSSEP